MSSRASRTPSEGAMPGYAIRMPSCRIVFMGSKAVKCSIMQTSNETELDRDYLKIDTLQYGQAQISLVCSIDRIWLLDTCEFSSRRLCATSILFFSCWSWHGSMKESKKGDCIFLSGINLQCCGSLDRNDGRVDLSGVASISKNFGGLRLRLNKGPQSSTVLSRSCSKSSKAILLLYTLNDSHQYAHRVEENLHGMLHRSTWTVPHLSRPAHSHFHAPCRMHALHHDTFAAMLDPWQAHKACMLCPMRWSQNLHFRYAMSLKPFLLPKQMTKIIMMQHHTILIWFFSYAVNFLAMQQVLSSQTTICYQRY